MKRLFFLLFLIAGMQLEANALIVKPDQVTYDVDLSANTAVVLELEKNYSGDLIIPSPLNLGDKYFPVVVGIAENAFNGCMGLKSVSLPETVTYIGHSAFYGCKNLKSVNIPHEVTRIEDRTFMGCESLSSIVVPEGVTYLGVMAFQGCLTLESINIPENVKVIGQYALANTALSEVKIPGDG